MITIPIPLNRAGQETHGVPSSYALLVILEDENMERLKQHDPGEIMPAKLGKPWVHRRLDSIQLIYASPDEVKTLMTLEPTQLQGYITGTLFRGWKYKPEEGDNDSDYQRPKQN